VVLVYLFRHGSGLGCLDLTAHSCPSSTCDRAGNSVSPFITTERKPSGSPCLPTTAEHDVKGQRYHAGLLLFVARQTNPCFLAPPKVAVEYNTWSHFLFNRSLDFLELRSACASRSVCNWWRAVSKNVDSVSICNS